MTWEPYEKGAGRHAPTKHLGVYSNGAGRVSAAARREWFEGTQLVHVHLDRAACRIGFEAAPDDADTTKALSLSDSNDIHLARALRQVGVDVDAIDETHHVPLEADDETGYIVADCSVLPQAGDRDLEDALDMATADTIEVADELAEEQPQDDDARDSDTERPGEYESRCPDCGKTFWGDTQSDANRRKNVHRAHSKSCGDDADSDDNDADDPPPDAGPDRVDLSVYGTTPGQTITPEDVVDALTGAQAVYQVGRDLHLGKRECVDLLAKLGVLDELQVGAAKIGRSAAREIVREVVGGV